MENRITIREAVTEHDVALFWEQLYAYYKRDLFPDPSAEERDYFLGDEYRSTMQEIHDRPEDRCHYLFFQRNGRDIGFALSLIYTSEDGKCFIMEFCVYPQYRGNGTGQECAKALLHWAEDNGARYAELNCGGDDRRPLFWKSAGFIENGTDEWGEPLMLLPPTDEAAFTIEVLDDASDWQLLKLENGFKKDIGEESLTEDRQKQLQQSIKASKITYFVAKRGYRAVGMCSVATCFSTWICGPIAAFDDFYIEPAFRKKGIARMLARAAQRWCHEQGMASLTVCCAPCDEEMYQSLGFQTKLGSSFACLPAQ